MSLHASWSRILRSTAVSTALVALGALACSGTDVGYPHVSSGASSATTAPSTTTGGAASAAGGAGTLGGQAAGGVPAGGAGAVNAGGAPAAGGAPNGTFQWPTAYDSAAAPTPADGHHNAGAGCMITACHATTIPFVFGGTVYKADGTTGAANVQVGISDGALTLTAYSGANGNIWLPSSAAASINWASAVIALRNKNGERMKPATAARGSGCNGSGCHGAGMRVIEP